MTKILIADDIASNLYLLESILKGNGYFVISARNGAEALAAAKKDPPDLIITDILMPVMDGFELCRQWKADERLRTIPFIFYTATYTDPKDEQFARSLGAERFLVKPLKPEIFAKVVRDVLEEAHSRIGTVPVQVQGDEKKILQEYNEVLFRKLEKKVMQLESEIAERKAAQEQREAVIRELEVKNAELARFTHTVSHELRTPLITIQGFAGLVDKEVSKMGDYPDLKNHVRRIAAAINTMDALMADLLRLSRAGITISSPEPVGFGIIAREAGDILAQPLENRGVRLEIAPDLPEVNVDRTRIREVMVNLIDNSIKFLGDQKYPIIRIGMDPGGKRPVFFVQDNGIGIEPRYLDRIFNLFEKLDSESPGTGVGLSIVKRIIEAHGGKIWAESEGPQKGATIRFTLPLPADKWERR
ncbi:hybrid sensor histidine kinase/response regulator [uncultured Methanoregula sp.]|uniref:hybrid sensor histidine kinase/response regulator n=1 Tax=uncultured Methanoregula sp. TaxID=1005933 RepID=UPI002AABE251|nr:hybrid sensor histidine kinase/response regulator [uncultured Methanoregula sp.]